MRSENDAVRKMLALNDAELLETIKQLCVKNGINTSSLAIGPKELAILRTVLNNAGEEDLARMMNFFRAGNGGKG